MPSRMSEAKKDVRGTLRASRRIAPATLARLTTAPRPPATLSDAARAEWERLVPVLIGAGTLTTADLRALELLVTTLASADELAELVHREGVTVPAGNGGTKGHPALAGLAQARSLARALLSDFGLTPKARGAVDAAPEAPKPGKLTGLASFR